MTNTLLELIRGARTIDLAQSYRVGMPQSANHPPYRMVLERRHGDVVRPDGGSAANELITMGCHVGTHLDALAHVSHDGLLHGGIRAADVQSNRGFSRLGIDEFAPFVGRGVLLDVAGALGVESVPAGYEITVGDLEKAKERAGVSLEQGDAVLIATGWARHWDEPETFTGSVDGAPGPGVEAARWLAGFRPRVVGAETVAFEHIPAGHGHSVLPVHRLMLVEHGINIIETLRLTELSVAGAAEFLFVLTPLALAGATGSPVRPVAVLT